MHDDRRCTCREFVSCVLLCASRKLNTHMPSMWCCALHWHLSQSAQVAPALAALALSEQFVLPLEKFQPICRVLMMSASMVPSFVSMFLKSQEADVLPHNMCPTAKFTLSLLNHEDPSKSPWKGAHRPGPGLQHLMRLLLVVFSAQSQRSRVHGILLSLQSGQWLNWSARVRLCDKKPWLAFLWELCA